MRGMAADTFEERVLGWVRTKDRLAEEILSVEAHGSDWAGSTEQGFYSSFSVTVKYRQADGDATKYVDVEGDDMANLWHAVVGTERVKSRGI